MTTYPFPDVDIHYPNEEELEGAVKLLSSHPGYMDLLKLEVIRGILRDDANRAMVGLKSFFIDVEGRYQAEAFVSEIIMGAWLEAHRKLMVDDGSMTRSIEEEKSREKRRMEQGKLSRIIAILRNADKKTQTEIIKQNIALTADNASLEARNRKLEIAADKIIKDAEARAVIAISLGNAQATSIIKEAESEVSDLEQKIVELQKIYDRLHADHDVGEYLKNKEDLNKKKEMQNAIFMTAKNIKTKFQNCERYTDENIDNMVEAAKLLGGLIHELAAYEHQFGRSDFVELVERARKEVETPLNGFGSVHHSFQTTTNAVLDYMVNNENFGRVSEQLALLLNDVERDKNYQTFIWWQDNIVRKLNKDVQAEKTGKRGIPAK